MDTMPANASWNADRLLGVYAQSHAHTQAQIYWFGFACLVAWLAVILLLTRDYWIMK